MRPGPGFRPRGIIIIGVAEAGYCTSKGKVEAGVRYLQGEGGGHACDDALEHGRPMGLHHTLLSVSFGLSGRDVTRVRVKLILGLGVVLGLNMYHFSRASELGSG